LGWSTFLVDFRGSGGSSGKRTSLGWHEAQDVADTMAYVQAILHEPAPVLYGHSMGAVAVLRATAEYGVKPKAIIADATFNRLLTTTEHRFELMGLPSWPAAWLLIFWGGWQNGFNGFAHNPEDYAKKVTCKVLLLRGALDPTVTQADMARIGNALAGPKEGHQFASEGHDSSLSVDEAAWAAVVGPFLERIDW